MHKFLQMLTGRHTFWLEVLARVLIKVYFQKVSDFLSVHFKLKCVFLTSEWDYHLSLHFISKSPELISFWSDRKKFITVALQNGYVQNGIFFQSLKMIRHLEKSTQLQSKYSMSQICNSFKCSKKLQITTV